MLVLLAVLAGVASAGKVTIAGEEVSGANAEALFGCGEGSYGRVVAYGIPSLYKAVAKDTSCLGFTVLSDDDGKTALATECADLHSKCTRVEVLRRDGSTVTIEADIPRDVPPDPVESGVVRFDLDIGLGPASYGVSMNEPELRVPAKSVLNATAGLRVLVTSGIPIPEAAAVRPTLSGVEGEAGPVSLQAGATLVLSAAGQARAALVYTKPMYPPTSAPDRTYTDQSDTAEVFLLVTSAVLVLVFLCIILCRFAKAARE